MRPTSVKAPQIASTIRDLDTSLNAHMRWLDQIHQALICGTSVEGQTKADSSDQRCAFGQWLESAELPDWHDMPSDLAKIKAAHRTLHDMVRRMLLTREHGGIISAEDYQAFAEQSMSFKLGVRAIEFGLMSQVCLIDHLTGVWNRSSMLQRLSEEFDRMLRTGRAGCLCMMDLDHFKSVNDTYGHVAGDTVLQAIAEYANRCLRPYDSMFRYGGEEFLFCLPNTSLGEALIAMERVRSEIANTSIAINEDRELLITASFGVAAMSPKQTPQECIEEADRALFFAKAGGRNRVCRWDTQAP